MKAKEFSSPGRLSSLRFAFAGLIKFFKDEPNARIHLLSTMLVVAMGVWFLVSQIEWLVLVIVMGLVWITEIINTTIERIMDFINPSYDDKVGLIKDMAAAAVLIASIVAMIAGLIIFIPKIF